MPDDSPMVNIEFDEHGGATVWYLPKLGFQPPQIRRAFRFIDGTGTVHDNMLHVPGEAVGNIGEMFFVTEMEALDFRITQCHETVDLYREYTRQLIARRSELVRAEHPERYGVTPDA